MADEKLEKKCYQCPECSGSGLEGVEDSEGLEYLPCSYCFGNQCFDIKTGDFFFGKCDANCGYNRERLKADWSKM